MKNSNIKITFKKESKNDVLNLFNKKVDAEGYIVEKDNSIQRVLTIDGEEIHEDEFGGLRKGSEIFFKDDLPSLMDLSKV
jgi:hypothetical protein